MRVRSIAVLIALVFAVAAYAHGDKVHVMGTLEKVSPEVVSVKTSDGKVVEVKLATTTVYVMSAGKSKNGSPAKFEDLAVGQKVVIHATPKGTDLIADEVKFGPAGGSAATKPAGN
ncbi:MAG TPA: hypothetical protein VN025_20095 [Candidatus Dormibacteraeota bacterium]|jgi:hypothetical protein|nr:hypothetical protein [Candidatus Dormibacteraeota bacterium]